MSFLSTNYSLFSLPVAFMVALASTPRTILQGAGLETFQSPRQDIARIEAQVASGKPLLLPKQNKTLSPQEAKEFIEGYHRQAAAHHNAWENLPLFFAAMVVGNVAKLDATLLNTAALVYLGARLLFAYAYANSVKSPGLTLLRPIAFWLGTFTSFALIIMGARKL